MLPVILREHPPVGRIQGIRSCWHRSKVAGNGRLIPETTRRQEYRRVDAVFRIYLRLKPPWLSSCSTSFCCCQSWGVSIARDQKPVNVNRYYDVLLREDEPTGKPERINIGVLAETIYLTFDRHHPGLRLCVIWFLILTPQIIDTTRVPLHAGTLIVQSL